MNDTGFYDSYFAIILFLSFTSPIFIHFLNCFIGSSSTIKGLFVVHESKSISHQVTEPYEPIVVNFVSKMPQQPKRRSKPVKRRSKPVERRSKPVKQVIKPVKQTRPIKSKKSPEKSHTSVKSKKLKTAKVNSSKPQPEKNLNKNNDLIKESIKSLKTLGYKSGEVKKTLQNLCISNEFKNSESLIEAFFKSR